MANVITTRSGGELAPALGGDGGPVARTNIIFRAPSLTCTLGDALAAQASYGWDQMSGSARVSMPVLNGDLNSTFSVAMGCGNNVQRFAGTLRQFDTQAFPHTVTAVGKGPLYALEEFKNDFESSSLDGGKAGIDFADLIGDHTATLKQIVLAVCSRAGVDVDGGNFDDDGHLYGLDGLGRLTLNDSLTWGTHETAAQYIHRFEQASAGFRLFDSSDGNIYLKRITTFDSVQNGGDATFTLGDDIEADSMSSRSSLGQQPSVIVQGWDDGSGPATNVAPGSGGGGSAYILHSPLIESDDFASQIADYWRPQVSRPQIIVRLTTPRDDLLGPGGTCTVNAAGGLGVNETLWIKSLTIEMQANGSFSQHLVCVAQI